METALVSGLEYGQLEFKIIPSPRLPLKKIWKQMLTTDNMHLEIQLSLEH